MNEQNTKDVKQQLMTVDYEHTGRRSRQYIEILLPTSVVNRIEQAFPRDQYSDTFIGFCYTLVDIVYTQGFKQDTDWPSIMGSIVRKSISYREFNDVRDALVEAEILYHNRHYKTSREYGKMAHAQRFSLMPYEVSVDSSSDELLTSVTSVRTDYNREERSEIVEAALGYKLDDDVIAKMMDRTDEYFEGVFEACTNDEQIQQAVERKEWYIKNIHDLYHGNIWHTRTRVNDRAHHNFTNLPTVLLRVLQEHYDLVEFDIKNSQIALLPRMFPELVGTRFAKHASDGTVYEHIMKELNSKDRNIGKSAMIRVLFDSEYRDDLYTRAIEDVYPELMEQVRVYKETVEQADRKDTKLSVKLQKIEAYYVLNMIYMDERLGHVPCFTRHDSIVVPRQYSKLVESIIKEKIDFDCRVQKKWYGTGYKVVTKKPLDECNPKAFNTESFICGKDK